MQRPGWFYHFTPRLLRRQLQRYPPPAPPPRALRRFPPSDTARARPHGPASRNGTVPSGHFQLRIEDVGHSVELDLHPAVRPGIPVHAAADGLRVITQLPGQEAEDGGIAVAVSPAGVQHDVGFFHLPARRAPFVGLRPPEVGKALHGIVEGGAEQLLPGELRIIQSGQDLLDEPIRLLIPAGVPPVRAEVQIPHGGIPADISVLPGPVDFAVCRHRTRFIAQPGIRDLRPGLPFSRSGGGMAHCGLQQGLIGPVGGGQIGEQGDDQMGVQRLPVRPAPQDPVDHSGGLRPGERAHGAEGPVLIALDPALPGGLRHRAVPRGVAGHIGVAAASLLQLREEAREHEDELAPAHGCIRQDISVPLEVQDAPGGQEGHGVIVPHALLHPRDLRPILGPVPEKAVDQLASLRHGQVGIGPDGAVPIPPEIGGMLLHAGLEHQGDPLFLLLLVFVGKGGRDPAQERQAQEQGDQALTPHSSRSPPRLPGRYIP